MHEDYQIKASTATPMGHNFSSIAKRAATHNSIAVMLGLCRLLDTRDFVLDPINPLPRESHMFIER